MAAELFAVVIAARAGDRRAFAELYRRFARAVHGVILARAPFRDAADLVQDVFALALARLPQLVEAEAFPGWLLAIARNRATDHLRAKRVPLGGAPEGATIDVDDVPSESSGVRASLEVHRVLTALRTLPEAYRETLILRLVEGLSGPEIAAQTGLAPGSVRVNLHRGMKLLREKLGITDEEVSDERVG